MEEKSTGGTGKQVKATALLMAVLGLVLVGGAAYYLYQGSGLCIRKHKYSGGIWANCSAYLGGSKLTIHRFLAADSNCSVTNYKHNKSLLGQEQCQVGRIYAAGAGAMTVCAFLLLEVILAAVFLCVPKEGQCQRVVLACIAFIGHGVCGLVAAALAIFAAAFTLRLYIAPYYDDPNEARTAYVTVTSFALGGLIMVANGVLGIVQGYFILVCGRSPPSDQPQVKEFSVKDTKVLKVQQAEEGGEAESMPRPTERTQSTDIAGPVTNPTASLATSPWTGTYSTSLSGTTSRSDYSGTTSRSDYSGTTSRSDYSGATSRSDSSSTSYSPSSSYSAASPSESSFSSSFSSSPFSTSQA